MAQIGCYNFSLSLLVSGFLVCILGANFFLFFPFFFFFFFFFFKKKKLGKVFCFTGVRLIYTQLKFSNLLQSTITHRDMDKYIFQVQYCR